MGTISKMADLYRVRMPVYWRSAFLIGVVLD